MLQSPDQPDDDRRPYAASANVMAVLERVRTRNLPGTLNADFFRIAGIGPAVVGRVIDAIEFLGLVTADGTPTDRLRAMAVAPEAEFRQLLAESVRNGYAEEFRQVNPEHDTQKQIVDAFRRYRPRSQTERMVMLFLGLCREAGIPVMDAPRERQMRVASGPRAARSAQPSRSSQRSAPTTGQGTPQPPTPTGLVFALTHEDVSKLTEEEFDEVWAALGKVTRARTRKTPTPPPEDTVDEGVNPDD